MEFEDIMLVLSEYSNLGAESVLENVVNYSREIDLLSDDIESRTQVLNTLLDELNEQKTVYDNSMLKLETLSVELIRTKTEFKKLNQNVKKLQSLNVSGTALGLTTNDRSKLATNRMRLNLMKQLLQTPVVTDDKMLLVSTDPFRMKIVALKDSKKKTKENRDAIWQSIGNCSNFNRQWQTLFQ